MQNDIGQLMMVGFEGTEPSKDFLHFLKEGNIGGVVLFKRNISSPRQLRGLVQKLQESVRTPLFIAVDHEGGRVFRMPKPFTSYPPMRELAKLAEKEGPEWVFRIGLQMAKELRSCGININFAPVLDVATNPFNPIIGDRAFSCDPHVVAKLGCQLIAGLREGGVMACGKHFPGHGDTNHDSHFTLPMLSHTRKRFDLLEFIPFRQAIAEQVPSIMTAHIRIPLLDDQDPATLSRLIVTNILRRDLGFSGLIVTDDLCMAAIAEEMTIADAAVKSIQAGCDVVLVCQGFSEHRRVFERLQDSFAQGELHAGEVEASLARLQTLKKIYCRPEVDWPPVSVIGK